ncbi:type IV toxin-antitoxin system AbiEi family antitoxin domain-containing protein [Corynebacterium sp. A21]|uniref:type IV toxin-antitoxin system AbiEi family antitoxin domain-containing protein n=1 Tax=Corynebacterium sp. A21 TaxID=3457318 RepID=UPI003FD638C4
MKIVEATEIVLDLAAQQWGLVTSAQAGAEGVSAVLLGRLVDRAVLTRIRSGVYAAEAIPWSPVTEIRAQWLALEPKVMAVDRLEHAPLAVVSHESAAELHGIGDLDGNGIHFTVPTRRQTRQPEVVFHIAKIDSPQWESIEGLAVTTPLRTVRDLAAAGHEPGHLADMTGDILHAGLATREEVADLLATIPHVFGITPGSREDIAAWLDERFPVQVLSTEQLLQRQIEAAWAPVREELQALITTLTPLTALPGSAHDAGDITGQGLQGVSERFGNEGLIARAAELAQHSGVPTRVPRPGAGMA